MTKRNSLAPAERNRGVTSFSVIVTSWNYRAFVAEAVDSVLAQTRQPEQLIVVDDGSTDGSADFLRQRYGSDPRVTLLLLSENGGQLAAFQRGVAETRTDVVCFLDADDRWGRDYLSRIGEIYDTRSDVDFVLSDVRVFGIEQRLIEYANGPTDLGYTAITTTVLSHWCGAPTSALSMRAPWARRSLDLPADYSSDWRLAADSCLVFGSSILGARKYYLPTGSVDYRIHERNEACDCCRSNDPATRDLNRMRSRRLIGYYARVAGVDDSCIESGRNEFRTKPHPTWADARRYIKVSIRGRAPWWRRIRDAIGILIGRLTAHWKTAVGSRQ